jgi:hypothetical protein
MDIPRQHWKKRTCHVNRVAAAEERKKERIDGDQLDKVENTHTAALLEKEREDTERLKNREMDGWKGKRNRQSCHVLPHY